jgi:GT2 family glycosyltransferase
MKSTHLSRGWFRLTTYYHLVRASWFGEMLRAGRDRIFGHARQDNASQPLLPAAEDPLRSFVILARPAPATLQPAAPPEVSVIIPVLNGIDYVRQCVESLYSVETEASFEVIAVDQNSTDGSREYLRAVAQQRGDFRLIENPVNVGFPQAVNLGASAARGAYLAIVNSDVIVTPKWLDHLLHVMRDDPRLAVVGPMTNYVGEGPQLDADARNLAPEQAAAYAQRLAATPEVKPIVDRLVFFCALINRRVFDLLGGMASVFGLGNFEDDDFCMRARLAGHRLALVSHAFVFHYGSRTFYKQNIPYARLMRANERLFYDRVASFATSSPTILRRQRSSPPEVSVIVRTRDRPRMLAQALRSLANQTLQDFEVIVVNDGGRDVSVVLEAVSPFLDVRQLIHPVSRGRAAALNAGIAAARGRCLAYLDDDDVVYPTHLETLLASVVQSGADVVYAKANQVLCWSDMQQDTVVERVQFPLRRFKVAMLLVHNKIPIMSLMHTAACLDKVGRFDEKVDIYEDWDFLIRLSQCCSFHHIPRVTSEYRFRFGEFGQDGANTLRRRQHAIRAQRLIYQRYPVTDPARLMLRTAALAVMKRDMRRVESIMRSDIGEMHKQLLVTAYLARFPDMDAQARKFGW